MKKIIIVLMSVFVFALASEADTNSTIIKISDLQYFSIQSSEKLETEEEIKNNLKPFALIQPSDKWFSKDKWMHLTTAYFLTLQSSYSLNNMLYVPQNDARNASIGITLSLSLGKELYDVFEKRSIFSWKDLCYDILGAGLGYYTTQLIK